MLLGGSVARVDVEESGLRWVARRVEEGRVSVGIGVGDGGGGVLAMLRALRRERLDVQGARRRVEGGKRRTIRHLCGDSAWKRRTPLIHIPGETSRDDVFRTVLYSNLHLHLHLPRLLPSPKAGHSTILPSPPSLFRFSQPGNCRRPSEAPPNNHAISPSTNNVNSPQLYFFVS